MRKYLHVELDGKNGCLFVYLDDTKRGKIYRIEDLDEECMITDNLSRNLTISIPTSEFSIKEKQ